MRTVLTSILSAIGLAFSVLSSQADPRGEVMSRAFRCSIIGDLRIWLDCYYGAAQPVRASLGLPPAPDVQQNLVASPPPSHVDVAEPELRNQVLSNAFQCGSTAINRAWLDCYYAAAAPARRHLGLKGAEAASQTPSVTFDAKPQIKAAGSHPDRLVAGLTYYSFDKFHTFTVVLNNGQTWRQITGDTVEATWKKPATSYTIIITRGIFGSFNMQVKGLSPVFKVERVF